MVITTPSIIMPPPTCDNYKTKQCILSISDQLRPCLLTFWPQIWCVHPCRRVS